jgi:DNA-nicking Smr family endonuclease
MRARPLPVAAELDLSAHAALVAREALLMFLETVERRDINSVVHGGEPTISS